MLKLIQPIHTGKNVVFFIMLRPDKGPYGKLRWLQIIHVLTRSQQDWKAIIMIHIQSYCSNKTKQLEFPDETSSF